MEIDKVFTSDVDGVADNLFSAVKNSVSEVKAMQQRKAAENVQLVIQALKKIESDLQDKFDGVTTVIEKRVSTIKDGRDGINGRDGRDGKEGRPGKDGLPGRPGKDGMPGRDGVDGQDGVSVTDARIDFDGSLIIGLSSGREINVGEVVAPDLAERIKVITNGGGTSQSVLDTLASLQAQINALDGFLDYKGTWNASTNTPTLVSSTGTKGDYYVVSVAGSTNLNGETNWGVGDWVVFNNSTWQKVDGGSTGNLTTAVISSSLTLDYGTANGVLYLNGSKVATSGAALTFNGTNLATTAVTQAGYIYNTTSGNAAARNWATTANDQTFGDFAIRQSTGILLNPISSGRILYYINPNGDSIWSPGGSEQMRLNTTGLGIGNNNPTEKLDVTGNFKLSGSATLSGGTANGVAYLNGSKVVTTGSALTFDGTTLTSTTSASTAGNFKATSSTAQVINVTASNDVNTTVGLLVLGSAAGSLGMLGAGAPALYTAATELNLMANNASGVVKFAAGGTSEQMRLTSTGLGIGTSSPNAKLAVVGGGIRVNGYSNNSAGDGVNIQLGTTGGVNYLQSLNGTGTNNLSIDANQVTFRTGSYTTAATLDASGNLGLGVTPSAWGAGSQAFQNGGGAVFQYNNDRIFIGQNNYINSSFADIYTTSNYATRYRQYAGTHAWFNAPSGTAGNAITFTQAMTLDASGNLLVGQTSGSNRLAVTTSGTSLASFTGAEYSQVNIIGGSQNFYIQNYNSASIIGTKGASPLLFTTNETERARIGSNGKFSVNTTDTTGFPGFLLVQQATSADEAISVWNSATSGDNNLVRFYTDGGAGRGSITYNRAGGLVAYNTTSDYRAKDIIGPVADTGATIDALKVYAGKMKGATQSRPMLVAHEAQAVAPYSVTGDKDAVNESGDPIFQQMDVSSLVPLLIAEIQSLRKRVAQLEGA